MLSYRGRIIDIYDSAETGCTVVQDLGDGYTATYGQLANLPAVKAMCLRQEKHLEQLER